MSWDMQAPLELAVAHQQHFTYGFINPAMAFFFSVAGSYLGLTCARYSRASTGTGSRLRWIALSSFALGGIGIWMMHFTAMIGFTVDGMSIAYDLPLTALSLLIAIASVAAGLWIAGTADQSWYRLIPAGAVCGLGVAGMHYTGMAAMRFPGRMDYDAVLVAASIVIAVVAATVALRFTAVVSRRGSMMAASVVMAVAVCGMHYTGMMAIVIEPNHEVAEGGIEALKLIIPILVFAAAGIVGLIFAVLGAPGSTAAEDYRPNAERASGAAPHLSVQPGDRQGSPAGFERGTSFDQPSS
ncbi:MHYT domain-containing protein [Salininema proteolyticum]|uniref:MHYT domain-containing protein n=1 Tax=Salininema proteolyticum TaxID=1607685 RepID=A0ABV8TTI7_9ACTN